jgi:hypothetical protein
MDKACTEGRATSRARQGVMGSLNLKASERVKARLDARIASLTGWLFQESPDCFSKQKHLDKDSVERAYWQYGYLCALRDVLRLLTENSE